MLDSSPFGDHPNICNQIRFQQLLLVTCSRFSLFVWDIKDLFISQPIYPLHIASESAPSFNRGIHSPFTVLKYFEIQMQKVVEDASVWGWTPQFISRLIRTRVRTQVRAQQLFSTWCEDEPGLILEVKMGCESECGRQGSDTWQGNGIKRMLVAIFGDGVRWLMTLMLLATHATGSVDKHWAPSAVRELEVVG